MFSHASSIRMEMCSMSDQGISFPELSLRQQGRNPVATAAGFFYIHPPASGNWPEEKTTDKEKEKEVCMKFLMIVMALRIGFEWLAARNDNREVNEARREVNNIFNPAEFAIR